MRCKHMHKDSPENAICEDCFVHNRQREQVGVKGVENLDLLFDEGDEDDR